jgi:hypothetical protein
VSLVIDDYSENWSQLVYVLIVGKAKIIEPNKMSVEQKTAVAALRLKYAQYRSMAIDQNPLIKILPDRVRLWSGGSF